MKCSLPYPIINVIYCCSIIRINWLAEIFDLLAIEILISFWKRSAVNFQEFDCFHSIILINLLENFPVNITLWGCI